MKKEKNELSLSKEAILKEGIDIKLTQSDVIDALVAEQIETILQVYEKLKTEGEEIRDFIKKEWEDAIENIVNAQDIPKGVKLEGKDSWHKNEKSIDLKTIIKKTDSRENIIFCCNYNNISLKCLGSVSIIYSLKSKGILFRGTSEVIDFDFEHSKGLEKRIKEHNEKVTEFCKNFKSGLNEKQIAKMIKNKFTKEILKTTSLDFKQKLIDGFGLTL